MVSWVDVQQWSTAKLEPVIAGLGDAEKQLLAQGDEAKASGQPRGWTGKAAHAAATKLQKVADTAELAAAELAACKRATIDAADAITGVERSVKETLELARRNGFTIDDSGAVSAVLCMAQEQRELEQHLRRVRAELVDMVQQTLRHADDIDADLSGVLQRILDGKLVDVTRNNAAAGTNIAAYVGEAETVAAASVLAPPPPTATASDNAAWWGTLSDGERKQLIANRPGLVGPRDGLPTVARDAANRQLLDRERQQAKQHLATLKKKLANEAGPGSKLDQQQLEDKIKATQGKLEGMEAIENRLHRSADAPPGQKYYLLGINADGDGQAIIAKGNPDTAANVATYVPGTGADLGGIEGGMDRSDRMYRAAERLGSNSTSVITWYDYDAPDDLVHAASNDYAEKATGNLDSFQNGLQASHKDSLPPAHNTVLGHSYGGSVVGWAAQLGDGLAADELVLVAAPGVGAEHASALNMPDGHVWATADPDDPVPDMPVLGVDPTEDAFGAKQFKADAPGITGEWYFGYNVAAHSAYWDPGNTSLRGMGKIIAEESPY